MKKLTFSLIITLLSTIIITLIAYNTLIVKNNSEKYQAIKQKYDSEQAIIKQRENTKVYCLGENLNSENASSYSNALFTLTDFSVSELGAFNDQSIDVSIRLGKTKIYTKDILIPATTTPVDIVIYNDANEAIDVLKGVGTNFTSVNIAGIPGTLKYDNNKAIHTFTRSKSGQSKKLTALTQIIAKSPTFAKDKIAVIFTGTHDPDIVNGIFKTVTYQRHMISSINTEKYIVVSLTSDKMFDDIIDRNRVLSEEHKEHFLDFRKYLLEYGLTDPKIAVTDKDKADLRLGKIPASLLEADGIQGNSYYNELLAKQIINKMIELGYIDKSILK